MIFKRGMVFGGIAILEGISYVIRALRWMVYSRPIIEFGFIQAVLLLVSGMVFIICSIKYDRSKIKRNILIATFIFDMLLCIVSLIFQFKDLLEAGAIQMIVILLCTGFLFVIEILAISDLKDYVEYERNV